MLLVIRAVLVETTMFFLAAISGVLGLWMFVGSLRGFFAGDKTIGALLMVVAVGFLAISLFDFCCCEWF